jgi:hypothetical protein
MWGQWCMYPAAQPFHHLVVVSEEGTSRAALRLVLAWAWVIVRTHAGSQFAQRTLLHKLLVIPLSLWRQRWAHRAQARVTVSEALQVRASSKHQQKKKSKINQLLTLALKRAHGGRSRGAAWTALNKEGRVGAYRGRAKMTLSYSDLTGRRGRLG